MDAHLGDSEDKAHFDYFVFRRSKQLSCVPDVIIVGAGPSGLATAACLREKGVNCVVLERSNDIASLWKMRTYDRLKLHLPKQFCELPFMKFPRNFPTYPSKEQFIEYLEEYAKQFQIRPVFNQNVVSAEFCWGIGLWRVITTAGGDYLSRWLVVATGESAEAVVPEFEGVEEFDGEMVHTSVYKSGKAYEGKKVLVVGCGNSGMEVCLDLCHHNSMPSLVVRDTVHILPREMLGKSTFGLSMWMLKWLPMHLVDRILLVASHLILGDTGRFGLPRPEIGPLQLKTLSGKTPVLDVGTLDRIRKGDIKVFPGIKRIGRKTVEFVDGRGENFDAIILATGYKSNVPSWLKENEMFSEKNGLPKMGFRNGWKGENGLYAVGFTGRGILGSSINAKNIATDIQKALSLQSSCKNISFMI